MAYVAGLYRRCSGCGSRRLERRGEAYDAIDEVVTGFQRCLDCGVVHMFSRRRTARERRRMVDAAANDDEDLALACLLAAIAEGALVSDEDDLRQLLEVLPGLRAIVTKDEAKTRAELVWGGPLTMRLLPGGSWLVEVGEDQRMHSLDANGRVICEHEDCSARARRIDRTVTSFRAQP
jgi:hypothetical protein